MEFINKNCSNEDDKKLCSILISKLIPNLDNLEFSTIKNNLQVIKLGINKYNKLSADNQT